MNERLNIFLVAVTYIGTVVGAGFATGKEIVVFFSIHGILGVVAIIISGCLFVIVGTRMMVISARIQAYSYQELNEYLFGNRFGGIINFFVFLVVICVTAVMLAGAGAIFYEQFGLPKQLGIIITLILCYIVLLRGLNGIFVINSYLVPILIIFLVFIAGMIFYVQPFEFLGKVTSINLSLKSTWYLSPFTYTAFNLMAAQVVLVPLGKEIQNERVLKWGGFFGGLGLCLLLLLSHFSLSAFPQLFLRDIPMAAISERFGILFHMFFLFVIYGEIFNTVAGNMFGIVRQMKVMFNFRENHAMLLLICIIFLMSQMGYGQLLTILYPLFGYIGLIFLVLLVFKRDLKY